MTIWGGAVALRLRRLAFKVQAVVLGRVTAVVDAGPDPLRFGVGRSLRNRILSTPLASLQDDVTTSRESVTSSASALDSQQDLVLLVTRTLGTGGVETVVATLARELPQHGVRTVVLCEAGGMTADSLRRDKIEVVQAPDRETARDFIAGLPENALAQLHNAPDHLIEECIGRGLRVVPVIHSTDINLSADGWEREAWLTDMATVTIAVSQKVRSFHTRNMPRPAGAPIVVIPNGVKLAPLDPAERDLARAKLASVLKLELSGAIVFVCLARYDLQKNIPGLVASFLRAAEVRDDIHLVVAGPIEDWLEHALANSIRCSHPAASRIHLMGLGASRAILAASDAFILDSFFEGWPVAATEAAMAGLPLILSDVGGAVELVGVSGERGRLCENPAAPAESITLADIRRARRRAASQTNQPQIEQAVLDICREIDDWRARRVAMSASVSSWLSSDVMVEAHARLLRQVAGSRPVRT
ncbi:glycosyltransferase involved in cell wall biosynthesis [Microlunatus panaciterrae]|uniref:Glycosyltransferase involved in cell wall biosynthesis n=1 Tax=Microlunatus panaciterrae TaxID=400768 RepID=A0ABS2RHM0_9ACTN|nr:glycosyltransferase involved in cell wall biosynthesis [Microlunatus panaciterrae]